MAKPISQFFVELGVPLRNIFWSWGARSDDIVLLRTWQDEYSVKERKVTVLANPDGATVQRAAARAAVAAIWSASRSSSWTLTAHRPFDHLRARQAVAPLPTGLYCLAGQVGRAAASAPGGPV